MEKPPKKSTQLKTTISQLTRGIENKKELGSVDPTWANPQHLEKISSNFAMLCGGVQDKETKDEHSDPDDMWDCAPSSKKARTESHVFAVPTRARVKMVKKAVKAITAQTSVKIIDNPCLFLSDEECDNLHKTDAYRVITRMLFSQVKQSAMQNRAAANGLPTSCASYTLRLSEILDAMNIASVRLDQILDLTKSMVQVIFFISDIFCLTIVGKLTVNDLGDVRETAIGTVVDIKPEGKEETYQEARERLRYRPEYDIRKLTVTYYFFSIRTPHREIN
jgi:hypothetical protein